MAYPTKPPTSLKLQQKASNIRPPERATPTFPGKPEDVGMPNTASATGENVQQNITTLESECEGTSGPDELWETIPISKSRRKDLNCNAALQISASSSMQQEKTSDNSTGKFPVGMTYAQKKAVHPPETRMSQGANCVTTRDKTYSNIAEHPMSKVSAPMTEGWQRVTRSKTAKPSSNNMSCHQRKDTNETRKPRPESSERRLPVGMNYAKTAREQKQTNKAANLESSHLGSFKYTDEGQSPSAKLARITVPTYDPEVHSDTSGHNKPEVNSGFGVPLPSVLSDPQSYFMACSICAKETDMCYYVLDTISSHQCPKNMLVVKAASNGRFSHSSQWMLVRETPVFRVTFLTKYKMCSQHKSGSNQKCPRANRCNFAHNAVEKILWNLDREGRFDLAGFIRQHQTKFSVRDFISKHYGQLRELCNTCFNSKPCQLSTKRQETEQCTGEDKHSWHNNAKLYHMFYTAEGRPTVTEISEREFKHKTAVYKLCRYRGFCKKKLDGQQCTFAHSEIERDFWQLENDGRTRYEIMAEANKGSKELVVKHPDSANELTGVQVVQCPFRLYFVCKLCKTNGHISIKHSVQDRCSRDKCLVRDFQSNKILLDGESKRIINPLPQQLPRDGKFVECKYGKKCTYTPGMYTHCQFYHSKEELQVWTWQFQNNVRNQDDLVKMCITEGRNFTPTVRATQTRPSGRRPVAELPASPFYCKLCYRECNGRGQWEAHCASEKHQAILATDQEQGWQFREPPWNGHLKLCEKNNKLECPYSDQIPEFNRCVDAHSKEELDEWEKRLQYRKMKRKWGKDDKMLGYITNLLDKLKESTDRKLMKVAIDDVNIQCDGTEEIKLTETSGSVVWRYVVTSTRRKPLQKVALLYPKDRLLFSITYKTKRNQQLLLEHDFEGEHEHIVDVEFSGGFYGSFFQTIVFDFGDDQLLARDLQIDVGDTTVQEELSQRRHLFKADRWSVLTKDVVPFDEISHLSDHMKRILATYKQPDHVDKTVSLNVKTPDLNVSNYIDNMHWLLRMEELERNRLMAKLNLEDEANVHKIIEQDSGGMLNSVEGYLFVRIPLSSELSEDSSHGQLILSSCNSAWLAVNGCDDKTVFEAPLVKKHNFGFDGRQKKHIYLCLSPKAVAQMKVKDKDKVRLKIQFQMDEQSFCEMHYALDLVREADVLSRLFPDLRKCDPLIVQPDIHLEPSELNEHQIELVHQVLKWTNQSMPPLVLFGPFGTGKTYTLAHTAMFLARSDPQDTKIMIATHSNSAADLYIQSFFHPANLQLKDLRLLRVYYTGRRINTVPRDVISYCLLGDNGCFIPPTVEDVKKAQIVIVTLKTSLLLKGIPELTGQFSHIFIDEAGQALEAEAILPITLAGPKTCIVLAGDHKQLSPNVYSQTARKYNLHRSLLERLFQWYNQHTAAPTGSTDQECRLKLVNNYRSHPDILNFVSKAFYGGAIKACSKQSISPSTPALQFFLAQGQCKQDGTSYYNEAEIYEISARIKDLLDSWPSEWGEKNPKRIAVLSCYDAQVARIRFVLRKKGLSMVTVDRVRNIQGKEFQVLLLSTVRSTRTDTVYALEDTYGFLSDDKLLNTALTRARACVIVVGDPNALCAIGGCRNHWQEYIRHCEQLDSIHPKTLSVSSVKSYVLDQMEMSQDDWITASGTKKPALSNEDKHTDPAIARNLKMPPATTFAEIVARKANMSPVSGNLPSKTSAPVWHQHVAQEVPSCCNVDDLAPLWIDDFRADPDEIIRQLVQLSILETPSTTSRATLCNIPTESPIKIDFKIREREGLAFIEPCPSVGRQSVPRRKLIGLADLEADYSDNSMDEEEENDEMTAEDVEEKLAMETNFYRCVMNIESSYKISARVIGNKSTHRLITIPSRKQCNRALNGDQVLVEIYAAPTMERPLPKGRVTGIIKRSIDPRYKHFVCMADLDNIGCMVPLNKSIPKIYLLQPQAPGGQAKSKRSIPIYRMTKAKTIELDRRVQIDNSNCRTQLFLVRYLKWKHGLAFPLGYAADTLSAGETVEFGMKILDIENNIPIGFPRDCLAELHPYHHDYQLPQSVIDSRVDLRQLNTYTIDPEGSKDLDDAISIDAVEDGTYMIGVHIADVSHFIRSGTPLDAEARKRGTTYYPRGLDPIHMLPHNLSTDLCSLLVGKDRLAITVPMQVTFHGEISQTYPPLRTVINSKIRLTYVEAERIIHESDSSLLGSKLQVLRKITQNMKKRRLGNAAFEVEYEVKDYPMSHDLVAELMIAVNNTVAKFLVSHYPDCTPLRCQTAPDADTLRDWKDQNAKVANTSFQLTRSYVHPDTCNCNAECNCIAKVLVNETCTTEQHDMKILRQVWDKIMAFAESQDMESAIQLLIDALQHPQQAMALLQWRGLQETAAYVRSGGDLECIHYSLNIQPYTHFTSPIRRYIDIVVHRMVVAAIEGNPNPYESQMMDEICAHCTDKSLKAKEYENATEALQLAVSLKNKVDTVFPIVQSIESKRLLLKFPALPCVQAAERRMLYRALDLACQPDVNDDFTEVTLSWRHRIYDAQKVSLTSEVEAPEQTCTLSKKKERGILDGSRHLVSVSPQTWQQILSGIRTNDFTSLRRCILQADTEIRSDVKSKKKIYLESITSESEGDKSILDHFTKYRVVLNPCAVLQVQLASQLHRGLLTPRVQLIQLTHTNDICVEHNRDPVACFAKPVTAVASRSRYLSTQDYLNAWLPVLAIESASGAIEQGDGAVVQNVCIEWHKKNDEIFGRFKLNNVFCERRHLFPRSKCIKDGNDGEESDKLPTLDNCIDNGVYDHYLCVRYGVDDRKHQFAWVGHCVTITTVCEEKHLNVYFKVATSIVPFPVYLLNKAEALATRCTIEWIPKTTPDLITQNALLQLTRSSKCLATDVALGNRPVAKEERKQSIINIPGMMAPNQGQANAISKALNNQFTLIQGPPGTGKTRTGVLLAYQFVQLNKTAGTGGGVRRQVMYCGPSNKSVDVVTDYLKEIPTDRPSIIRLYGITVEHGHYPLPREPAPTRRSRKTHDDEAHRDVTLHHMIRTPVVPQSGQIRAMDKRIQMEPVTIKKAELDKYKKLLNLAKKEVLKTADIILCTCAAAGLEILRGQTKKATNIVQIIIDEAGMCTEPESMIPIVNFDASNVTLIGDHKQLQPIIKEESAARLKLNVSLFERYADITKDTVMLTTQYRMHYAICEFPSQQFYSGRLVCANDEQRGHSKLPIWPAGRACPVAFCHVLGVEEATAVTTAESGAQSCSNRIEAQHAVRIVIGLVNKYRVDPNRVIVLSQYRAQCVLIEKLLEEKCQPDISVSTVVTSQGSEWDYVILSSVRSLPEDEIEASPGTVWRRQRLGFITDHHQINVAITRARKGLLIIGNMNLLKSDQMWCDLIRHYEQKGALVKNIDDFLP